ncbi:hypothetical protein NDU88_009893 [Pleurodeles waltl]|uniref:Uncharacterized protein n=1 Tax=Pleurodeles waltl TaxID=8319 RepID=A0AAV7PTL1_PLEWA|nr:hypothetical protein NDU88_009893 [Pleurodeles waltl]
MIVAPDIGLQKCLPAQWGEAWRLPPNFEAPLGVPGCLAVALAWIAPLPRGNRDRPWNRGGAAERRKRWTGLRGELSPGGLVSLAPVGCGAWGAHPGPREWLDLGVSLGPQTSERPEGEGCPRPCSWTGGCGPALSTQVPMRQAA